MEMWHRLAELSLSARGLALLRGVVFVLLKGTLLRERPYLVID